MVSEPATRDTRERSGEAVISVKGTAELEDSNARPEGIVLSTWPLIVATGLSEWRVWLSTTTTPGELGIREAVMVRSAAASVERSGDGASMTDGSTSFVELAVSVDGSCGDSSTTDGSTCPVVFCADDKSGVDTSVGLFVTVGSWIDGEDMVIAEASLTAVCGPPTTIVECVAAASPSPVDSAAAGDLPLSPNVTIGGWSLLGPGKLLTVSQVVLLGASTPAFVEVVIRVSGGCTVPDIADSAPHKTDRAFSDEVSG